MTRARLYGVSALALVLLPACHVGPNYRPPPMPSGAEATLVSLDPAAETASAARDDWWRLYSDARLDALLQEAFRANADLAVADANLSAAQAVLQAARTARYPQTDLVAGGTYGRDPVTDEILELNGHPPETFWTLDDALRASVELDLYGRVRRSIESARADAQGLAAARDAVRVAIAAETTRAYGQICALGEQVEVARHSLEVVTREAQITVNRHEAGANSQFDVARAQGLVAQVRADLAPLQGQRRAALFQLAALLGRTPAHAPADAEQCVRPPQLGALMPIGDGAALLKRRPDVRRAERTLAAATARIGVLTADLYPRISLSGFYGGAALHLSDLTTEGGLIWGLGPSISWSFPTQSAVRARIRHHSRISSRSALRNQLLRHRPQLRRRAERDAQPTTLRRRHHRPATTVDVNVAADLPPPADTHPGQRAPPAGRTRLACDLAAACGCLFLAGSVLRRSCTFGCGRRLLARSLCPSSRHGKYAAQRHHNDTDRTQPLHEMIPPNLTLCRSSRSCVHIPPIRRTSGDNYSSVDPSRNLLL